MTTPDDLVARIIAEAGRFAAHLDSHPPTVGDRWVLAEDPATGKPIVATVTAVGPGKPVITIELPPEIAALADETVDGDG